MLKASGDTWTVYMLRCADGSLYTGITTDITRRCKQHNAGNASRYTRSRRPARLVFQEAHANRSEASKREESRPSERSSPRPNEAFYKGNRGILHDKEGRIDRRGVRLLGLCLVDDLPRGLGLAAMRAS